MSKKVVVGMSGGVDSSVAAYLLKKQGYEVIGVTVRMGVEETSQGSQNRTEEEIARTSEIIGIKYEKIEFKSRFNKCVKQYFIEEYRRGHTPNPCIACNRYVKWDALLCSAKDHGAEKIATGHYARIVRLPEGRYTVCASATAKKDQTYALYALTQEQLAHTLMPVGDYEKDEIRRIAADIDLPAARRKESQDICFVPDHDYAAFIRKESGQTSPEGNFVDEEGCVLGRHRGLIHYTVGQRKGLGISAEMPLFVKELRTETNEVVLCRSEALFTRECRIGDVNYMAIERLAEATAANGRIRYSHAGAPCVLYPEEEGSVRCVFEEPQRAITPGQAAVFYRGNYILCGGTIM